MHIVATWPGRTSDALRGAVPFLLLLALGLAIRLLLAFVLFPQSGLGSDIRLFASWSLAMADYGPVGFYANVGFSDYPPAALYALWALGICAKIVADLTGGAAPDIIPVWVKLPAILADVVVAVVLYRAMDRWQGRRAALIASGAYLLTPVTWYDSALWGQVDAFGVLVLALAMVWLIDRRPELASAAAILAFLVKPQFAIALPVVGLILLRRHLIRRRDDPQPPSATTGQADRLTAALDRRLGQGPLRLVTSALAGAVTLLVVILPFDLPTRAPEQLAGVPIIGHLAGLASLLATTAASYNVLTANAYNPWAFVGPTPLATSIGSDYRWTFDSLPVLGVPAFIVGVVLFIVVALAVAALLWRRDDRVSILLAITLLAVAFYVLPTRVHERYLFAAIGMGAFLVPLSRSWAVWFAGASAVLLVNMHAVLTLPFRGYGTPEMHALPFADLAREPWVVAIVAIASVAVLAWPLWVALSRWRGQPARLEAASREQPPERHSPGSAGSVLLSDLRSRVQRLRATLPRTWATAVAVASTGGLRVQLVVLALVSAVAAAVAARFGGFGGPWLWNFDMPLVNHPFAAFLHDAVTSGGLPLWNDALGMGFPLFAEGQIGALYPVNWLVYQLPPLVAMDVTRIVHLTLAGVGAGLITLRLSGSRSGAIATALVTVMCGGAVSKLEWTQVVVAYGWLPWVLLPLLWQRRGPTVSAVVAAGAVWGIQALAAHPPYWTLTGIAALAIVAFRLRSWVAIPRLAAFGLVAAGIGAVQLLPTLVLTTLSWRAQGVDAASLFEFSATPVDFLAIAFANALVPAADPAWDLYQAWYPSRSVWGIIEVYAYVGLPALAFAAVGLQVRRARPLLFLAAVMVAIPIAGVFEPGIWASTPLLNGLRHPVRSYLLLDLAIAIAAGIGVARLGLTLRWRWAALVTGIAVAGYAAIAAIALLAPGAFDGLVRFLWPPQVDPGEVHAAAVTALTRPWPLLAELVLLGLALLVLQKARRGLGVRPLAAAIVALPLLFVPGFNQVRPESEFSAADAPLTNLLFEAKPRQVLTLGEPFYPSPAVPLSRLADRPPHFYTTQLGLSLRLQAANELIDDMRGQAARTELLRAVGVDTVVNFSGTCPAGREVGVEQQFGAAVCQLNDVLRPPYWLSNTAVTTSGSPTRSLIAPIEVQVDPDLALASAVGATVVEWTSVSASIVVEAPSPGYVFIDRAWYPWWEVTVDDARVPVYRAWSGQLVHVPAGTHRIEQRFVPLDLYAGAAITLTTLVSIAGVAALRWRRRRGAVTVRRGATGPAVPEPMLSKAALRSVTAKAAADSPTSSQRSTSFGLDAAIVLALLVMALLIRAPGLERPMGRYFDETLHVRTAAEFLQGWRYGLPKETSEWTHPHLAKYAMAAGIETVGALNIRGARAFEVTVADAVIEPARMASNGAPASPSRIYMATPGGVVAAEIDDPRRQKVIGVRDATRLVLDDERQLVWIGSADGALRYVDTSAIDTRSERPPPSPVGVASLEGAVRGMWSVGRGSVLASDGGSIYLVRETGLAAVAARPDVAGAVGIGGAPPGLVVMVPGGLEWLDATTLEQRQVLGLDSPPLAMGQVDGSPFENQARGLLAAPVVYVSLPGGLLQRIDGLSDGQLRPAALLEMPGDVSDIRWNPATNLVHLLGSRAGQPTIFALEPRGESVFADVALPIEPIAWGLDVRRDEPAVDRGSAVVVDAAGRALTVDVGATSFAARLPGLLAGAATVALIYALARLLFRPRGVALLAGGLALAEGLLFSQSRIATPDVYTGFFVLAAYVGLALILRPGTGPIAPGGRRLLLAVLAVGALLGLAAATKWTGVYALGGVVLLMLLATPGRARWLAVGLAGAAAALLTVLSLARPQPDLLFPLVAVAGAVTLGYIARRWQADGSAWSSPLVGRQLAWAIPLLAVSAAVVYVATYVPFLFLDAGRPQLIAGWPGGHGGETLLDLQARMFAFHEQLQQEHGAGSPWWSWPLVLKPLWAYLESFAGTQASVLMASNLAIVWLSIPALGFVALRALRRVEPALVLLLIAFALQWLPWARIERVSFFYHFYTALPFALIALAYLLWRLWDGPSPRTWLWARVGAITAIAIAPVLWLATGPLCQGLNVDSQSLICTGGWSLSLPVAALLWSAALVGVVAVLVPWLSGRWLAGRPLGLRALAFSALVLIGVLLAGVPLGGGQIALGSVTLREPMQVGAVAAVLALPLVALVIRARQPRRFVIGVLTAVAVVFVLIYPTLTASRMPTGMPLAYQALLPTWEGSFIFGSGTGPIVPGMLWIALPLGAVALLTRFVLDALDLRLLRNGERDGVDERALVRRA